MRPKLLLLLTTALALQIALTIGLTGAAAASAPVVLHSTRQHPFVDASGKPVHLIGFDLPPVWGTLPGKTYAADRYTQIASRGFTAVRFFLHWKDFESAGPGEFNQTNLTTLDTAIGYAKAAGLYVILSEINGSQGMGDIPAWAQEGSDQITSIENHAEGYIATLAARFRSEPAVAGYEFVNEPQRWPIERTAVLHMYSLLISSERQVDPAKIVLVEPTYGSSYMGGVDWSALTVRDNVVYTIHDYFAGDPNSIDGYSHSTYAMTGYHTWGCQATGYPSLNAAQLDLHLKAQVDAGAAAGLPVWVGEFSVCQGVPNYKQWIIDTKAAFDHYGLDYAWWECHTTNGNSATDANYNWFPFVDLFAPGLRRRHH
jgi:Cellulase (glycosyl hydrolase family 5)